MQQAERVSAQKPNHICPMISSTTSWRTVWGLKMLTVLDEFTRECLGILGARSITAAEVIGCLELLMLKHGAPENVRSDNGPEFVAKTVKRWAYGQSIRMNYIELGSPWENGHVESFHGKFRDACLNREVFGNLLEAKVLVEDWRQQ